MELTIWIVAIVAFTVLEAVTTTLVALWFIFGSLAALLAAALGAALYLQVGIFVAVSGALLLLLRPLVKKYVTPKRVATNADRLIGMDAVVTEHIHNLGGSGTVKVNGTEWSAVSESGADIHTGAVVRIIKIEGVKVYVELSKVSQTV